MCTSLARRKKGFLADVSLGIYIASVPELRPCPVALGQLLPKVQGTGPPLRRGIGNGTYIHIRNKRKGKIRNSIRQEIGTSATLYTCR